MPLSFGKKQQNLLRHPHFFKIIENPSTQKIAKLGQDPKKKFFIRALKF